MITSPSPAVLAKSLRPRASAVAVSVVAAEDVAIAAGGMPRDSSISQLFTALLHDAVSVSLAHEITALILSHCLWRWRQSRQLIHMEVNRQMRGEEKSRSKET